MMAIDMARVVAAINLSNLPPDAVARVSGNLNMLFKRELIGVLELACVDGELSAVSCGSLASGDDHGKDAGQAAA